MFSNWYSPKKEKCQLGGGGGGGGGAVGAGKIPFPSQLLLEIQIQSTEHVGHLLNPPPPPPPRGREYGCSGLSLVNITAL